MSTEKKEVKKEEELDGGLMDFSWDNSEDFFGIKTEDKEPEPKSNVIEVEDDEDSKVTNLDSKKKEEPAEEKETFFDEEDEEESQPKAGAFSYSEAYKVLKEKGIITVDVEAEGEIDEETFIQIQEEEIESRLDETIKAFMEELDDDAKAFLKFKKEGGNTKQFFEIYTELSKIPTPIAGDDKSEEKFLKYYLSNYEELDDEDVEDRIEFLKESGKLSKYAQKYYENIEEEIQEQKEQAVKRQQEIQRQQEQQRKEYVKELKSLIEEKDVIQDWSITQKDKKQLHGYMTKAAVKVSENQFLTQFQYDLQQAFKDKEKTILLAKLISNDFDLSDLKEKAKTEIIKETRSKLSTSKTGAVNNKGSRNKGIADYF